MCVLVVWERDLGTAIIIAGLMLGMLWMGGMKGRQLALLAGVGFAGAAGLILSSERADEPLPLVSRTLAPIRRAPAIS